MTDKDLIVDEVVSTAERLEESNTLDLDPLEVKVESTLDGRVTEVTAVLTTGGPHIEVDLYSGTVRGYWGSDEHIVPIMDSVTETELQFEGEHYEQMWQRNVKQ